MTVLKNIFIRGVNCNVFHLVFWQHSIDFLAKTFIQSNIRFKRCSISGDVGIFGHSNMYFWISFCKAWTTNSVPCSWSDVPFSTVVFRSDSKLLLFWICFSIKASLLSSLVKISVNTFLFSAFSSSSCSVVSLWTCISLARLLICSCWVSLLNSNEVKWNQWSNIKLVS